MRYPSEYREPPPQGSNRFVVGVFGFLLIVAISALVVGMAVAR